MQLDVKWDIKGEIRREKLVERCVALIRGPSLDIPRLLASYFFGGCDLSGFNVDLCRFWMRSARQRLGKDTPLERMTLFFYELTVLRPDMALEIETIPNNKFYYVIYPFGRRRARHLWIPVQALPTLIRQGLYHALASGELRSHGEVGWAGILWYESYDAGNRVMAKILDETPLRLSLLAAAMRAFYLEAKQLTAHYHINSENPEIVSKLAAKSTQKAISKVIQMILSRTDIWLNATSNANNVHLLQQALDHMVQKKFSKAGLESLATEIHKTLAQQFPSSTSKHLEFLQQ